MTKPAKADPATPPAKRPHPSGQPRFLRYADFLQDRIVNEPKRTKGARTRDALKLGAIRMLDDVGYHAMRVSDICDAAKVSGATFYLYFTNKSDITLEVLSEYLDEDVGLLAIPDGSRNAFESIRAANLRWLQVVKANAGLARCIMQLGDEEPGFRELVHRTNREWYERIAHSITRKFPDGAVSSDVALLAAYALGAMMDEMARKLVVHPDPSLLELAGQIAPTDKDVADFFAVLWHQALYGAPPPESDIAGAALAIGRFRDPPPA